MTLVFHIAGRLCPADQVCMRGNTLEAEFNRTALAALADAYDDAGAVTVQGIAVTYSVQTYRDTGDTGCKAVFSVNSSRGRILH